MPSIDPLSVVVESKDGHRVTVSRDYLEKNGTAEGLNSLRCLKCHKRRYAGWKVAVSANAEPQPACLSCLRNLEGKKLTDYNISGELPVVLRCQVDNNKKHEIPFNKVDGYCESNCQLSPSHSETGGGMDLRCDEIFNPDDLEDLPDFSGILQRFDNDAAEDLFIILLYL